MRKHFKKTRTLLMTLILMVASGGHAQSPVHPSGGASFNEVWDVTTDKYFIPRSEIESTEFAVYQNGLLPQYPVNVVSLFSRGDGELRRDAIRTTSERFDYYDRLAKKLHSNGVCVAGEWSIEKSNPYSGMFAHGQKGLFIGRISVAMEKTTQGHSRGFGFAGKVFPTLDPDEPVTTGNFFTVDVLMGTPLRHVLDAKTTNEPDIGFNWSLIGLGIKIASALKAGDENPGFRPLTQIAAAGLQLNRNLLQPRWLRLSAAADLKHNDHSDFRNEILTALQDNKILHYNIEVSDTTHDRSAKSGWHSIGHLTINQAVVSYGCDRRLHFAHPKLK